MNDNDARVVAFFSAVQTHALPRIVKATVPFYAVQNDRIVRDRSAVLFRVADEHFLLTVAHDLEKIIQNQIVLYAGWDSAVGSPVPLHDSAYFGTEENGRDLAVIKLEKTAAKMLLDGADPIGLSDLFTKPLPANSMFMVCGYPQEWLTVMPDRLHSEPLAFIGRTYKKGLPPTQDFIYDPRHHLLLEFTRECIGATDAQPAVLPRTEGIKGISGCGVWWLCDFSPGGVNSWRPEQVRLVALEHRYWQQSGCVAATRIGLTKDFLEAAFPSLRSALRIAYP